MNDLHPVIRDGVVRRTLERARKEGVDAVILSTPAPRSLSLTAVAALSFGAGAAGAALLSIIGAVAVVVLIGVFVAPALRSHRAAVTLGSTAIAGSVIPFLPLQALVGWTGMAVLASVLAFTYTAAYLFTLLTFRKADIPGI